LFQVRTLAYSVEARDKVSRRIPLEYVGAEGRFMEGETERRAGIFIGPEFGTLSRVDLVAAAREAMAAIPRENSPSVSWTSRERLRW
jgi:hypothetical protein